MGLDKIILYDKHGDLWSFSRNSNGELCYTKNKGRPQRILENATEDFELITDSEGDFHLVAQTDTGSLIYLKFDFENWKKYVLFDSKSASNSISGFKAFVISEKIHCFYVLSFKGKCMLTHHIFSEYEQKGVPEVVSYTDSSKNFSAVAQTDGTIHIFFTDENSRFKYKIYKSGYSDGVFPTEDDVGCICPICDSDDTIHLLYTANLKSYHTLIYFNLLLKERKIISFGDSPLKDCCMEVAREKINIRWRERNRYYECVSADGGANFKKPSVLNFVPHSVRLRDGANPLCLNSDRFLRSEKSPIKPMHNHKTEKNDYTVIDGNYSNRLKTITEKLAENEKEILKLNTIIHNLTEKLRSIEKSFAQPQSNSVEEVNKENYEIFNNTDINNMEFGNPKTF